MIPIAVNVGRGLILGPENEGEKEGGRNMQPWQIRDW